MSIFEAVMLLCFGMAWPISIARTYRSRSTKGKSPVFSIVILVGYVCGIINKVLNDPDFVIGLYALNFAMVFIDLMLWYRNRRIEREEEAAAAAKTE